MYHLYVTTDIYRICQIFVARFRIWGGLASKSLPVAPGLRTRLVHLRLVPKTNFQPNCAGHSTQCERALDVVSLCCSYYYCSSY